jgi:hypothetical protein
MNDWRYDLATIALFVCVGPFVGMMAYGLLSSGLSGLLAPLAFLVLIAVTRTIGLIALVIFGVAPAFISAVAGVLARRSGHPKLFMPASILGGLLSIYVLQLTLGGSSARRLYLTAFIASTTLALLDISIRRWSPSPKPRPQSSPTPFRS